MTDSTPEHTPRDIGTALASTIGIFFVSSMVYSSILANKDHIYFLKNSTWYEIELTSAQHISFDVMQFRTGERKLYIDQNHHSIYEHSCNGFNTLCKDFENKKVEMQSATFYSNHEWFTPNAKLILKSIHFIDTTNTPQTLLITKTLPNDVTYIAAQKRQLIGSFILIFFVFSIFTLVFYFNHLGRYLGEIQTVQLLNKAVIGYYLFTIAFVILQLILM